MVRNIIVYPDPILRERTEEVDVFERFRQGSTNEFFHQIQDMKDVLLMEPKGAALAANQIGIRKRMFVIAPGLAKGNSVPEVIINPTIVRSGKLLVAEVEGCLSFPNQKFSVTRPKKVEVKYLTEQGIEKVSNLSGFIARVFQHEIDHLNGVLFIDHLGEKNA